jgi:hypothetical protein
VRSAAAAPPRIGFRSHTHESTECIIMNQNESTKQSAISWTSGINLIAGIWLFIATWALNSQTSASRTNDWIFGVVIVVLAWIRLSARSRGGVASWLNVLAGIWLIIAPFALHYETAAQQWNSVVVGIVVAVLGIASGATGATTGHPAATA